MLHGAKVGAGVLQQSPEDEGEADAQVHVDGLDEAVCVGQRGASAHHQCGHGQDGGYAWRHRHRSTVHRAIISVGTHGSIEYVFCSFLQGSLDIDPYPCGCP